MNPLRTIGLLGALFAPGLAFASHGSSHGARVEIANEFDGEVEVYLDGRFSAIVPGDARIVLETRPGPLDVRVQRPGTGFVLVSTRIYAARDARIFLPVEAPKGVVRLRNGSDFALRVDVDGQEAWLSPRSQVDLRVTTGHVDLFATIPEARSEFGVTTRDLWVEPGRIETTVLAPDPSVVRVFNRENIAVRVMLDGADAGLLQPGDTRLLLVHPGVTRVVLIDLRGNVRYSTVLDMDKGETAVVDLRNGPARGAVPVRVSVAERERPARY
jgi:hypothetical protein